MSIRAVCFDVGGVLIRISFKWRDAAESAGLTLPAHFAYDSLMTECDFFNRYQEGLTSDEQYLEELSDHLGGIGPEAAKTLHNGILIEPYPGVFDLVKDIKAAGLIVGCLSNTNEPHWRAMENRTRFPAHSELEVRLASHEVGLQKPSLEIFRLFEARAGVRPHEVILFDDLPKNVEAALECGWNALRIDPHLDPALQMRNELLARQLLLPQKSFIE